MMILSGEKIIVLGGNAAGMSAASKAARMDRSLKITVYQSGNMVSYAPCGLPYYVGGLVADKASLIARTPEKFRESLGIDIRLNCRAVKVIPESKKVVVVDESSGNMIEDWYDKLVIAVGAKPVFPDFPGKGLENVFTVTKIDDAVKIKEALEAESIEDIVIAGSGYIGLEMLENFIRLGKRVRVIDRNNHVLSTFEGEISELIEAEIGKYDNVTLSMGESFEEILGASKVEAVKTDRATYKADMLIMALGIRPDTEFLRETGIGMLPNGAIAIDRKMKSSLEDIYAAGDCAGVYHRILGDNQYIALGTVANKQGRILGENLAGGSREFPGVIGSVVTRIMDLTIARTGIGESAAREKGFNVGTNFIKAKNHAGYYPGASPVYIKLIYETGSGRLLGAQLAGKSGVALRADVFAVAIQAGMTLDEIGYLDLVYAPPFAGVWDAVNIAANSSKNQE
ncbi:CoA-disulfide reductase [Peptoclostridium acidaminophilum]|uniref:CoA-disulfide reductase n=1 Tax=Peptoclostridium acidaminophilum TaxID=1731 RepID=UPI001FA80448|nr:CoA-disulfide reductase [Peptoclostridium acidaminophilum]